MSAVEILLTFAGIMVLIGGVVAVVDWNDRTAQRRAREQWLDSEVRMIAGRPDDR